MLKLCPAEPFTDLIDPASWSGPHCTLWQWCHGTVAAEEKGEPKQLFHCWLCQLSSHCKCACPIPISLSVGHWLTDTFKGKIVEEEHTQTYIYIVPHSTGKVTFPQKQHSTWTAGLQADSRLRSLLGMQQWGYWGRLVWKIDFTQTDLETWVSHVKLTVICPVNHAFDFSDISELCARYVCTFICSRSEKADIH